MHNHSQVNNEFKIAEMVSGQKKGELHMINRNKKANQDQTSNHQIPRWGQTVTLVVILGLLAVIAVPGIAFAAIATIDTDDNTWDSNWGTPMRVDTTIGPDGYDIDTFWVNTDAASPTVYYFGLTTVGPLADDAIVYFWIDCNDNNVFTDNADRVIEYDPLNDWVTEYTGDEATIEFAPDANGEVIGGNSVEVQTNNTGDVSWASCQVGNHSIKAEIWNDIITNVPDSSAAQSSTVPRIYDLPTAVALQSISANPNLSLVNLSGLLVALMMGVAVAVTLLRRRRVN